VALAFDVGLLTGVLYLTGGPMNPFSVVYLVPVTLAAVALGHRWASAIGGLATAGYGLLFVASVPLDVPHAGHGHQMLTLHLGGMWVAFAAATLIVAQLVGRLAEASARQERQLAELRLAAARSERMAALLALGAGAAHELSTPLNTIAVAAAELERSARDLPGDAHEDLALIRHEVERCRDVLSQLSGRAEEVRSPQALGTLQSVVEELQRTLGAPRSERLVTDVAPAAAFHMVPALAVRQVLGSLLRNAFDASPGDAEVRLEARLDDHLRIVVRDIGAGMDPGILERVGEPFFTTKPPGTGLGLGLFLARAVAERLSGRLDLRSAPARGTEATLTLPRTDAA
jgi:two-component system sensor histidine kinase RegB